MVSEEAVAVAVACCRVTCFAGVRTGSEAEAPPRGLGFALAQR